MLEDHPMDGERIQQDVSFCRRYLLRVANGDGRGTVIPFPGSSTYANEAVIQTCVPRNGKLLIHSNGAYGDRLMEICVAMGQPYKLVRTPPTQPASMWELRQALMSDPTITHMMVIHCETSSGIINPVEDMAELCQETDKGLLIDAVSSFGVLELDMQQLGFEAIVLGSNKCLEGPPGLAWVIADERKLVNRKGNARSLSLDIWDQWQYLERSGCFRFTPPTHVVAAVAQALREHEKEGGRKARLDRYQRNRRRLVDGMRVMGFETLLPDNIAAPIVATFLQPEGPRYDFMHLCNGMARRGFHIFPGRLAVPNTLRIGCIGALNESKMDAAIATIGDLLEEMGITMPERSRSTADSCGP
jgi:2-aminoethylphosphonate-pyruvate transaminase